MGISRDRWHKHRKTGGKRPQPHKKRKYEMGRPAAMTKLGTRRVRLIRTRGGNSKCRALRLDAGNFSWGSEAQTRRCRIIDVVYNPSNNELVRTKTLTRSSIVHVDAAPFKQWYETYYGSPITPVSSSSKSSKSVLADSENAAALSKSRKVLRKLEQRQKTAKVEQSLVEQFQSGRVLACIASRPGKVGRADGYILEGTELDFYVKKIKSKRGKAT
ncbi:hypothetical protein ACOME3_005730 [Neoechinorhynchus agilis]